MAMPLSTVRLFVRRFQPASSPHGCITDFFTSAKNARHHRRCFSTRADRNRVQYDSWLATGRLQYRMETALLPASVPLLPPGQREGLLHLSTTRRGVSGVSSGETLPPDEETGLVVEGEGKPGLVIVDGSMLLHRAHHRAAGMCRSGHMSEAEAQSDSLYSLLTALDLLLSYLKLKPAHFVLCFDAKGKTFRHRLCPEYKQSRPPTPYFIPVLKQDLMAALTHIPLPVLEVGGVEADDVIGTLTTRALANDMSVVIASADKDFFQLLSPGVTLLRQQLHLKDDEPFRVEDFCRRFVGLQPHQYVDLLALKGDPADDIKGVRGIGQKKACDLLRKYESVENLLNNLDSIPSDRTRKLMEEGKEAAVLSKTLAQLRIDLPHLMVPSEWEQYAFKPPRDGGQELQKYLEGFGEFGLKFEPVALQFEELWADMGAEADALATPDVRVGSVAE